MSWSQNFKANVKEFVMPKSWIRAISGDRPGVLTSTITWHSLSAIALAAPYGFAALVIVEYYSAIETGEDPSKKNLISMAVASLAFLIVHLFLTKVAYRASYGAAIGVQRTGQLDLAQHLKALPMGFFCSRDAGDLSSLMIRDFENIRILLFYLLPHFFSGAVFPIIAVIALFGFDWRLTLSILILIVVAIPFVIGASYMSNCVGRRHHAAANEASSRMLEYIEGIKPIKSFNVGGDRFQKFKDSVKELRKMSIKLEAVTGPFVGLGGIFLHGTLPAVMLTGVFLLQGPGLNAAIFIIFLSLALRICDPLMNALVFMSEMTYMTTSARRIEEVMETKPLPESKTKGVLGSEFDVAFSKVDFSYNEEQVLFDVCCEMKQGTMTALIGPSGSGKSTMTRLIARFWDVCRGKITISGVPITRLTSEDLIDQLSVVFQDVYLFHESIRDNIALARPDADWEDIEAASKSAHCHDFIMNLPNGYDTMVGEGGNTLSGGEKQRISIARAILKDAPVILLDEATSSLDARNEVLVQEALSRLVEHKTLIVIAHKLSSVVAADQILVLDKGRIIERGTHTELLSRDGLYASMWNEQQQVKSWQFKQ